MNKLDEHLDMIQEENLKEFWIGEPSLGIAVGVGSALIITNLLLVFLEIANIRVATKLSPKYTKMLNNVLSTNDWKVNMVKDDAPNAFAAGGKYVFLTTGLQKHMSDREITAIMLHEVYHNKAKHIWKGLAYEYPFYYLIVYLLTFVHTLTPVFFLAYLAFKIGLAIARIPYKRFFGRRHEYKADEFAAKYGYGDALVSAFKKLEALMRKEMSKSKCGRFCKIINKIDRALDEHPEMKDRIENIMKKKDVLKGLLSGNAGKIKRALMKALPERKV